MASIPDLERIRPLRRIRHHSGQLRDNEGRLAVRSRLGERAADNSGGRVSHAEDHSSVQSMMAEERDLGLRLLRSMIFPTFEECADMIPGEIL